ALRRNAEEMRGFLTELRRDLHREPEIGLDLPRSQKRILRALRGLPLEISLGSRTTSITAVLRGKATGNGERHRRSVLIRADMDALPVHEAVDLPYRSVVDGAMHACGHDMHSAMLVGAAHLLSAEVNSLAGDVVFM